MSGKVVLVTGGLGFVGCHVVLGLLREGYVVRVSVRSLEASKTQIEALEQLARQRLGELERQRLQELLSFVEADVLKDEGWDQATLGCWSVIHLAGVLPSLSADIPDTDFMTVMLGGLKRVLTAAGGAGVSKVVYLNGLAAVNGNPMPIKEGQMFTEEDWTDMDFPKLEVHSQALTLAEKYAWDFVKNQSGTAPLSLTVLVATSVNGPPLTRRPIGGTLEVIDAILNHRFPGSPNVAILYSDVRDVAEAAIKSLVTPAAANQRICIHSGTIFMPVLCRILAAEFGPQGYTIFTNTLPAFVLWLPSLFIKKLNITENIGKNFGVNNTKMKDVFGITPRSIEGTLHDMIYAMIDLGYTYKAKKYKQIGSRAEKQEVKT